MKVWTDYLVEAPFDLSLWMWGWCGCWMGGPEIGVGLLLMVGVLLIWFRDWQTMYENRMWVDILMVGGAVVGVILLVFWLASETCRGICY